MNLLVCSAYHGTPNLASLLAENFKRAADWGDIQSCALPFWNDLRRYPALFLLYGVGLATAKNGRYDLLRRVLYDHVRDNNFDHDQPLVRRLHNRGVMNRQNQAWCFAGDFAGLSDHLFDALRNPLREYLPDDRSYAQTFDWLEDLLCLTRCAVEYSRSDLQRMQAEDPSFILKGPVGRFMRNLGTPEDITLLTALPEGQPLRMPPNVAAVLRADFFGSAGQVQMFDKYRASPVSVNGWITAPSRRK